MKSLCGNSYGCLSYTNMAIGFEFGVEGGIHACSRCMSRAIAIVEFFVGEPIEWVIDEWVPSSKRMEKLESMILYQALKPVLRRLSDVK